MQLGHFGKFRSIALFDVLLDEFDDDTPRGTEDDLESFQKLPLDDDDTGTDTLTEDDGLAAEGEVQLESDEELLAAAEEEAETWSDDPVRMYLTQMGEIPLLTRDEEIRLAKAIEVTRRRFRTKLLECDYVMQFAYKILKRVHTGELPFDRTVQVSVTDRLEKDQILGRLPHNLKTLDVLLKRNARDYRIALSCSQSPTRRKEAWECLGPPPKKSCPPGRRARLKNAKTRASNYRSG
jgi:RNA polymerase primary sigma factor